MNKKGIAWIVSTVLAIVGVTLVWNALHQSPPAKKTTVAIVNPNSANDPMTSGFLDGLTKGGFLEGKNLTLLRWEHKKGTAEALAEMVGHRPRPDLIFTVTTPVTREALKATTGTDIPVIFAMHDPVGSGLIKSLAQPGGNLTGVQIRGSTPKALEWLLAVAPKTKHLYVPVAYDTKAARQSITDLKALTEPLGIKLTVVEVQTEEELDRALAAMPADVDAGFVVHSILIARHVNKFVAAAMTRKIPLGSGAAHYANGVTVSFGLDRFRAGQQASRLACKVLEGTAPADIPTEVATFFLGINLKSAQASGIPIPNDILLQADFIVR